MSTLGFLKNKNSLRLGFGCAGISGEGGGYSFGRSDKATALDLLHTAYDRGVTVYDTAPIYGHGLSEKRIGEAFYSHREKVFLISKSGVSWHLNQRVNMSNDPLLTKKMLENSLRDLRSDYIDLYMIHWPDPRIDIRKTMEVLAKAKSDGKICSIGLCNTTEEEILLAEEIESIEAVQSEFNFFENRNKKLFNFLKIKDIRFISWGTLDKGLLTRRASRTRTYEKNDYRGISKIWKKMNKEVKWGFLDSLHNETQQTLLELALGYNFSYDLLDIALVGIRTIEQLESSLKAAKHCATRERVEEMIEEFEKYQKNR